MLDRMHTQQLRANQNLNGALIVKGTEKDVLYHQATVQPGECWSTNLAVVGADDELHLGDQLTPDEFAARGRTYRVNVYCQGDSHACDAFRAPTKTSSTTTTTSTTSTAPTVSAVKAPRVANKGDGLWIMTLLLTILFSCIAVILAWQLGRVVLVRIRDMCFMRLAYALCFCWPTYRDRLLGARGEDSYHTVVPASP